MVQLKVGKRFEIEVVRLSAVFIRVGAWERYFNRQRLPSH
jgi:hypothetical protein